VALQFDFYNIAMFYLHPGIPLALLLEAFLLFFLLRRWIRFELVVGHAPIIDGLRGFLAFGVFVHHASIWYYFLQHGSWVVPESRLYTHLGQSTVTVFFMITGFLFYGKVLESKKNNIDWLRLYVSRCLRILPLFLLVMLSGALVIALIRYSGWVQPMQQPWNEKSLTGLFTAGVTWTLGYEWKFYYALPFLALTVVRVPWQWLIFSAVMLLVSDASKAFNIHAAAFAGGVVAAVLAKVSLWVKFSCSGWASACVLALLTSVVAGFDTAYAPLPLFLLAVAFALMANGSGLWGLLSAELPRAFGELTYSMYLLHGPLLFFAFRFVLGFEWVSQLNSVQYWSLISLLTPILLVFSAFSYKCLEKPCMSMTTALTLRLRKFAG
jgi:peptidoglycan/LPS O-acetylase OafA/YrhL